MANRFDVSTTSKYKFDKMDRLIVEATPTRAGVFTYYEPDGNGNVSQVKELRHPDEVFAKETLDSLNNIPYTTQENHASLMRNKTRGKIYGYTLSGAKRINGDMAFVKIKVTDEDEINAITGKESLELSNGYSCDIVKESGEYNGERYDQKQTNIIYDHVARVQSARGGDSCRIRLDSLESAISGIEAERVDSDDVSNYKIDNEDVIMSKEKELPKFQVGDFRLDGADIEYSPEQEGVIKQLLSREKSYQEGLEEAYNRLDAKEKELSEASAKVDVLGSENEELKKFKDNAIPSEKLDAHVKERAKYLKFAEQYKIEDAERLDNDDILREIAKKSGKVKDEAKLVDMTYTRAVFDMLDHEYEKKRLDADESFIKINPNDKGGNVSSFDKAVRRRG